MPEFTIGRSPRIGYSSLNVDGLDPKMCQVCEHLVPDCGINRRAYRTPQSANPTYKNQLIQRYSTPEIADISCTRAGDSAIITIKAADPLAAAAESCPCIGDNLPIDTQTDEHTNLSPEQQYYAQINGRPKGNAPSVDELNQFRQSKKGPVDP